MNTKLDNFIFLLDRYFGTFYVIKTITDGKEAKEYFESEYEARERYETLLKELKENPAENDGVEIVLTQVDLKQVEDELESEMIFDEEGDY